MCWQFNAIIKAQKISRQVKTIAEMVIARRYRRCAASAMLSAEGVETQAQLDLLAKEGCQIYQGFLYSEPVSGEALAAQMAAQ